MASVIIHSDSIFSCNLVGSRVLIPSIEHALKDILLGPEKDRARRLTKKPIHPPDATIGEVPLVMLRKACVSILCSLLPLPNHFQEWEMRGLFYTSQTMHKVTRNSITKLDKKFALETMQESEQQETDSDILEGTEGVTSGGTKRKSYTSGEVLFSKDDGSDVPHNSEPVITTSNSQKDHVYTQLRGWLGKLLVDSLKAENDPKNTQILLWSLCFKVLEDADISPGIAQIVISVLCQVRVKQSIQR